MDILISSHAFAPSVGGIETVSDLLGREFLRLGHEVTLITETAGEANRAMPFPVVRQPSIGKLFQLLKCSDVFWQNNLSLRTLWPTLFIRRPVVVTHQGSYCRRPEGVDLIQRLKLFAVQRYHSVAISRAVGNCFRFPSTVIPNPFDAELFGDGSAGGARPRDLIFVGRVVEEKGLDILLAALPLLFDRAGPARLTIVGDGPLLPAMRALAIHLGVHHQVEFAGSKPAREVAELLHRHKILVVPSRYDEPFGVVALEGIAAGCAVVGSSGGGLPEAIGPCGITFPNQDKTALADALAELLSEAGKREQLLTRAAEHLRKFHPRVIAKRYLEIFREETS